MTTLQGKGFFTWKLPNCEGGDPNAFATQAKSAGLTHVLIKIADGVTVYNGNWGDPKDYVTPIVQALKGRGIQVWGWHYVYGNDPIGEANRAIQRIQQFQMDGYAIDAEQEYKDAGKKEAAKKFMAQLRTGLPSLPVALASYRYPSYHPQLPWKEFLDKCDINMPQVYWEQSHNAGNQLIRSVREFQAMTPYRPVIPIGAAYRAGGWQPTMSDVLEFLQTAQSLNLSAVNFWEWGDARSGIMPGVWETISAFPWGGVTPPQDICEKFIAALNAHDANKVTELYTSTAVHITSARTIQGTEKIRAWYTSLLTQLLPNANFTLTGFSGTGSSRHLTWTATSSSGNVQNGNDTFGLLNDKITYHYAFFTIQ